MWYKIISITCVCVYAIVNYIQWVLQCQVASFSPEKIVSTQIEHFNHYFFFHCAYLVLVLVIVFSWFRSVAIIKETILIHMGLLLIVFLSVVLFKRAYFLPLSGYLAKILLNDVLQKPIYPLLLLMFFIIGKTKSSSA